jgi:hypothetical protein
VTSSNETKKKLEEGEAGDELTSAPESGQPPGGREPVKDDSVHPRGPLDTPPPESNGEDF